MSEASNKGPGLDEQMQAAAEAAAAALGGDKKANEAPAKSAPADVETIARLETQIDEWKSRAYRQAADLENMRKRHTKEREETRKFGIEGLLKDLLPVVDNMERALGHAETEGGNEGLVEGVRMVWKQFLGVVESYGARPFEALGEPFDPQVHEAMTQMPSAEHPPNTVIQVFQRGWMLHDRLVRPAMVVVSKAPEGTTSEDDSASDA
ncbi:MAG: nucleotide exchange factor GrpE [Myxococcales bacterium]|nr:nucleotide exchange factor GrpE [Myxococcales bacterium]